MSVFYKATAGAAITAAIFGTSVFSAPEASAEILVHNEYQGCQYDADVYTVNTTQLYVINARIAAGGRRDPLCRAVGWVSFSLDNPNGPEQLENYSVEGPHASIKMVSAGGRDMYHKWISMVVCYGDQCGDYKTSYWR